MFKQKSILVAGAAGFVPGHLAESYLKEGHKVTGIDNFITGSKPTINLLKKYKQFEFIESNIYENLPQELNDYQFDYIFSLASPASPIDFSKIPFEIMLVNSRGTHNLLELARIHQARFLEASTSEVYGDPKIHPQTEDYTGNVNIVGPRSCYDESKRFAETLTWNYHLKYKLDTKIVRIFNTYGPRMRPNDGRVIPNFINQAIQELPITVYGDGKQTRSFCYVDDLVKEMKFVMESSINTPVNIGNPQEQTILEVANYIKSCLKSPSPIIFKPMPKDDPVRRKPSLAKYLSLGGEEPSISFQDGIEKTIEYFKSLKM